ncbi:segregation and condensation protein B [Desulfosporosinus orientis DSM 765]|uniref:Segregation and condensation protein B n=1 Tax=Desulfosporosinus orientis (strain ATCC 19365 / DSM 765 / NCIMB 8382 / VKM B-1628 / Singapore I) TaxID=768706 RepID=G7WAJ6_DESOD|nr:SMC-Scp complex subunit ScpB [Desulfosporosinus orientis]AET66764.1 segregation and condensation protein B [Desulfosporosinus orientis DSM 765]
MLFREPETAALEALLFVAKEPLTPEFLGEILELDSGKVEELLYELRTRYTADSSGLDLIEVNGGYKLGTKPQVARYIEILYKQPAQALSNAALEVLSIIAYKQPVTRGEVDFIRGVQSDRALATLVEKGLVKDVGRKEGPGRPILYATTEQFLLHFGLRSLEDMPDLDIESLSEEQVASTQE